MWDLLPDERKLGGAPANFAFRLKELGDQVILVSRIGDDELGTEALRILSGTGFDISQIQCDRDHPTGTVNVFFDQDKNPDYEIIGEVAFDYMEISEDLLTKASNIDCLAFGTLAQRSSVSRKTMHALISDAQKAVKFCDINLRKDCYTYESVLKSLELADIIKLNENELGELRLICDLSGFDELEAIARLVSGFNLKLCLVTYEEFGALAVSEGNEIYYSPGYKVRLEDSLGAGDAFSAAFIHKYLAGRPVLEALDAGNLNGAMVAMQRGAMQPLDQGTFRQIQAYGFERVVRPSFKALLNDNQVLLSGMD